MSPPKPGDGLRTGSRTGIGWTRKRRALLSTLVASSNDTIFVMTPDGVITHWNAAAARMFGYSASEIIGQSALTLVPEDLAAEAMALFGSVRDGGEVSSYVTERLTKDGRRLLVSLTLSAVRDSNGVLLGFSALDRDVTADQLRERERHEALKLEAVGQLAGGVAHDLNNILSAMMADVHLMIQSSDLTFLNRARLADVQDDCRRAAKVVHDLLAVGRKQVIRPSPHCISDILAQAAPTLRRVLGDDAALDLQLESRLAAVVDRDQLLEVFIALSDHARRAGPGGRVVAITTADESVPGGGRVIVKFAHDGARCDEEACTRLFEPYFTTRDMGPGFGPGLSAVHGAIAQLGGTITCTSAAAGGMVFTISLPATEIQPAPKDCTSKVYPDELRGIETILLVEDDSRVRSSVAIALRHFGYTVLEAENGCDALAILEQHASPFHLALCDVVMPEMNGPSLVSQLRAWYPGIRVLFITGHSEEAVASYGALAANSSLLMKPFGVEELVAKVRLTLDAPLQLEPAEDANSALVAV